MEGALLIKYLLIDGADCIVAQRLIDAGPLTVENFETTGFIKTHLYASMVELPESI